MFHDFSFVNAGVVQHNHRRFLQVRRDVFELGEHETGIHALFSGRPMQLVGARNQSSNVDFVAFFDRRMRRLTEKLPAVGRVAGAAQVAFIAVEHVHCPTLAQAFQLHQLRFFKRIPLRVGLSLAPFSYSLISATKTFKKAFNVLLLTPPALLLTLRFGCLQALAVGFDRFQHRFPVPF